jgi:hypothetical protein
MASPRGQDRSTAFSLRCCWTPRPLVIEPYHALAWHLGLARHRGRRGEVRRGAGGALDDAALVMALMLGLRGSRQILDVDY